MSYDCSSSRTAFTPRNDSASGRGLDRWRSPPTLLLCDKTWWQEEEIFPESACVSRSCNTSLDKSSAFVPEHLTSSSLGLVSEAHQCSLSKVTIWLGWKLQKEKEKKSKALHVKYALGLSLLCLNVSCVSVTHAYRRLVLYWESHFRAISCIKTNSRFIKSIGPKGQLLSTAALEKRKQYLGMF